MSAGGDTDRLLSKMRLAETASATRSSGWRALGAPRRWRHEGGADYIARLKDSGWLRPVRHPGNLAFAWSL